MASCIEGINYKEKAIMGVHGYLREHINKIKYLNLPYDLIELITIWYGTIDYWNINNTHSSYKFIKYNNSIIRNKSYDGLCYHTYGSLKITKSDIKIWKLQLLSMDNLCTDLTPLIGIINNKKIISNANKPRKPPRPHHTTSSTYKYVQ
eukprot:358150_1